MEWTISKGLDFTYHDARMGEYRACIIERERASTVGANVWWYVSRNGSRIAGNNAPTIEAASARIIATLDNYATELPGPAASDAGAMSRPRGWEIAG